MKRTIDLITAPTGIQPGGYISEAYADAERTLTPKVTLSLEASGKGWRALLLWPCAEPVTDITGDTNRFVDAAALLVPRDTDAPMMSMGAEDYPVEGLLWRANEKAPRPFEARGLGSVERLAPRDGAAVTANWDRGSWGVAFEIDEWAALTETRKIGLAIWQGREAERAGLKSVTEDWIEI